MNLNFSAKAKYSVSSRNPVKLRAGQGSSASSGENPAGVRQVGGRITGAGSFGPSASATDSTWAHSSSYSGSDTFGAARRNSRSPSSPSAVSVMPGTVQRSVSRSTATARAPSGPTACGLGGAARGRPDSRTASISTGQTVMPEVVR